MLLVYWVKITCGAFNYKRWLYCHEMFKQVPKLFQNRFHYQMRYLQYKSFNHVRRNLRWWSELWQQAVVPWRTQQSNNEDQPSPLVWLIGYFKSAGRQTVILNMNETADHSWINWLWSPGVKMCCELHHYLSAHCVCIMSQSSKK